MKQLPIDFENRMKNLLGDEFETYKGSLEEDPVRSFRVNTDKISLEDFNKINIFNTEKIPYSPTGFYFNFDKIGNHPYHHAGMIYVQEPGAMAPAECIDIEPDWKVLDMCAAPGGKTTQIAGRMMGEGFLLCNEINPKRAKILSRNMERMAVSNALVTNEHPANLAKRFPGFFDRVLVDAPCSGEGMLRREPQIAEEWTEENVLACADRQLKILDSAAMALREGGVLVYSTCTFAPEENEETVAAFLQEHPEFTTEAVDAPWFTPAGEGAFRLWPHKLEGEGHYLAVFRKEGSALRRRAAGGKPVK